MARPHGVDKTVDQVKRREAWQAAHPGVLITSPRQNDSRMWRATWTEPGDGPDGEGAVLQAEHWELRALLDHLEARFDRD